MSSGLKSFQEVKEAIEKGSVLALAGDAHLLSKLPKGNWVGGTIPYFLSAEGGITTKDKIFMTDFTPYAKSFSISTYETNTISRIYEDGPQQGFSLVILPATSPIHLSFATDAPSYPSFAQTPLIGWISGVHLNDLSTEKAMVFQGKTGESWDNKAVTLSIHLAPNESCEIGIINIFQQGQDDTIEFLETGFTAKEALVNGKKVNFCEYLAQKNINFQRPLVANYEGANINVSFQKSDEATQTVSFYAPVFKGVKYKQAAEISNYIKEFEANIPKDGSQISFSCNCILNYLYSELEGKKTGQIIGPVTFGEVAYQLLNQTLVYLTIIKNQ